MQIKLIQWDIFCSVVDNFGDIGICWRLSRQLVAEYDIQLRLWVDDLTSFKKICPQVNPTLDKQLINNVIVCLWSKQVDWQQVAIADVVIEALACTIPECYQQRMAEQATQPLWLNLEYLSAESWVESCHGLASPQAQLKLNKYFYFPGFTAATGGLLQEQDLVVQRKKFLSDQQAKCNFWQQLQLVEPEQYHCKISLFGYDHSQIAELLKCWQQSAQPILCIIPEGTLAKQVLRLLPSYNRLANTAVLSKVGHLTIKIIPFMSQQDYDRLLWLCDINFVRGEDSIIRAHWALNPFIWQLYRQQEQSHLIKLQAFLQLYTASMPAKMQSAVQNFYLAWNSQQPLVKVWHDFIEVMPELSDFNQKWQQQLTLNGDLARNLVHFVENKFIIT